MIIADVPVAHPAAVTTIQLVDNRFKPRSKTVRRGTTVRFVWGGKNEHNVTAYSGPVTFHSKTQTTGTYTKHLRKRGTYQITCTVHASMLLTIKVR